MKMSCKRYFNTFHDYVDTNITVGFEEKTIIFTEQKMCSIIYNALEMTADTHWTEILYICT